MIHYSPLGDHGIQLSFGKNMDEKVNLRIHSLMNILMQESQLPILECIPAYTTLSIYYDAIQLDYWKMKKKLEQLALQVEETPEYTPEIIDIPVLYGGECGPDLEKVASYHQLSTDEVIHIHSKPNYLIYMLGFSPGFPYLGGMSEKIATPRLATPRAKVEAGSVGIAGEQTGIYSVQSPGGWNIIGKTPLTLYNSERKDPILLQAGNYIRFIPIDEDTYHELERKEQRHEENRS